MEEETGRPSIRRLLAASCWLFLSFHRLLLFLLLFFFLPERAREPQPAARLISPTRPHFHVVIAQSVGALSTHRSVSLSGYSAPSVCARARLSPAPTAAAALPTVDSEWFLLLHLHNLRLHQVLLLLRLSVLHQFGVCWTRNRHKSLS